MTPTLEQVASILAITTIVLSGMWGLFRIRARQIVLAVRHSAHERLCEERYAAIAVALQESKERHAEVMTLLNVLIGRS